MSFFNPPPSHLAGSIPGTSYGNIQRRRSSVIRIPELADLEKPSDSHIPETCDVLIYGTGIVESILAASLAWQGTNVLHIDANSYYGDSSACLNVDQLKSWVDRVNKGQINGFQNALLYIPVLSQLVSRNYIIDLTPRIMFAKSDLLSLLLKSRVYRYLEFQPLASFHTYENDSFDKILSSTKQDIFTDQSLSLQTKRNLMKFIKFVLKFDDLPENITVWSAWRNKPVSLFLAEEFKLDSPQIAEFVHTIGLCSSLSTPTLTALIRIKRYLTSLDIYGNFPVLYSKFGNSGELAQGFCRSAAVAGATYKLNTSIVSYDRDTSVAKLSDGTSVKVNEKMILSPSQFKKTPISHKSAPLLDTSKAKYEITRLITVVSKDCHEWMVDNQSATMVVFPENSLPTENKKAVFALIMNGKSGICPINQSVWYLSTIEKGQAARNDLESALQQMEKSLLRESSFEDFDFKDVNDPMNFSLKLGQSLQNFVPKEKLQYLLKVCFTQLTNVPPFDNEYLKLYETLESVQLAKEEKSSNAGTTAPNTDVSSAIADDDSESGDSSQILFTNFPSSEISYDGVVSEVKYLYSKIVGSDDDFFDVDFEDEEEEMNEYKEMTDEHQGAGDFADDMEL